MALFRPMDPEDRDRLHKAVDSFVGRFDGRADACEAIGTLMAGVRDAFLDRDCDGDADLLMAVIDRRHFAFDVIRMPGSIPDYDRMEEALGDELASFGPRNQDLLAVLSEISKTIEAADLTVETGLPGRLPMPGTPPVGLKESLLGIAEEQEARGVLTSPDDGWPDLHPSLIAFLKRMFREVNERLLVHGGDFELAIARRSQQETVIDWPVRNPRGGCIGRRELNMAAQAFARVSGILRGQADVLSSIMSLQESQRIRLEEERKIEEEKVRIRASLAELRGSFEGLSDAAARRIETWIETGKPFPLTVFRATNPGIAILVREIVDWLGQEGREEALAAFHAKGRSGVEGMSAFAKRLRNLASAPAPRP